MTPCRLTRIVRERAKSCPCNRTTMRSIARAPKYRHFCLRPRRDLSNVCYVDVWAVCRHVFRAVSGIRADTVSDEQPHDADRLGMSEIAQSPVRVIGRLCVPSLGRHTIVTRNLCYVDVRSGGMACLVVSGIRTDTVFDARSCRSTRIVRDKA